MAPTLRIAPDLDPCPCLPAIVWAEDIAPPRPTEVLPAPLEALIQRAAATGETFWPGDIKARVRKMLRHGKYRPSGRSKPASEFLLKAAQAGRFPAINPPVDANNAVSLESGLPGSIFDTSLSGEALILRRGQAGERYVFNPSGQAIELQDLLLVARDAPTGSKPCGNPVKDSMATKICPETRRVVAVLYAPHDEPAEHVAAWAKRFAKLLSEWCQAREVGFDLIHPHS